MTQPNKRLLISYAHPDDESFGLGALIAKYVAEGVEVYLICATDGSAGTIAPEFMNGYNSVREVRLAELDAASEVLGFKQVYMLDYDDSGMMGSKANENPNCLWNVHQRDPDQVVRRVVEVLRDVQPQVVITFNKYGGYGHPDHIAIQRATTEAFSKAGDPDYDTGQTPYQPQKLYYSGIPRFMVRYRIWRTRIQGQNPRAVGRNKDIDIVKILDYCEPAHVAIDIRDYFDNWDRANACHKSQGGTGIIGRRERLIRRLIRPKQHFTRVHPIPARDTIDENDLFDHVQLDVRVREPVNG